jgi:hypothetical protein
MLTRNAPIKPSRFAAFINKSLTVLLICSISSFLNQAHAQEPSGVDPKLVVITQEHFLIYLTAMNSDAVRPALHSCYARETRRMQKNTADYKQQLQRAETVSQANELRESIAQLDGAEPVFARATCLAHGTVLMLHMFGIGDPTVDDEEDLKKIRAVLADRTPAGWATYAKLLNMESTTDAYKAAVSRNTEAFVAQVGANLGQSYQGANASGGNSAPIQKKLSALEDELTLTAAAKLGAMTSNLIDSLVQLTATSLDLERFSRLDPSYESKIGFPAPFGARFISNGKSWARLAGCSIRNNDLRAQVTLRDAVCTP